ncbi:MAG: Imidazole glycerol phosphate synthase subunit HisH [Bacteroidota bacterium]|jgi:glutamine amidotransferase
MSKEVAIIKYNAGNVASVMYALDRIGVKYIWTDDEQQLRSAEKIIFPGVGEASTAMNHLREKGLDQLIPTLKQPVLATCIGMQLLCKSSEENDAICLGVFDVDIKRFQSPIHKIPHVGWNEVSFKEDIPLFHGMKKSEYMYFVHSYFAPIGTYTLATCNYIHDFSAMLHKDNFYAAQFHTEISGLAGQTLLQNFVNLI